MRADGGKEPAPPLIQSRSADSSVLHGPAHSTPTQTMKGGEALLTASFYRLALSAAINMKAPPSGHYCLCRLCTHVNKGCASAPGVYMIRRDTKHSKPVIILMHCCVYSPPC